MQLVQKEQLLSLLKSSSIFSSYVFPLSSHPNSVTLLSWFMKRAAPRSSFLSIAHGISAVYPSTLSPHLGWWDTLLWGTNVQPPQNTIIERRFRWNWHTAGPSQSLLSVSSVKFKDGVLVCVLSELKWQPPVRGDVVISPLLSCLLSTPLCLLLPLQLVPDALRCGNKHALRPETQAFSIRKCSQKEACRNCKPKSLF